jgi:hypothetical protein
MTGQPERKAGGRPQPNGGTDPENSRENKPMNGHRTHRAGIGAATHSEHEGGELTRSRVAAPETGPAPTTRSHHAAWTRP